jgi:hypothetical protein
MKPLSLVSCVFLAAVAPGFAQEWEIGGGVGYGLTRKVDITNPLGTVRAGFDDGLMWTVYGAQNHRIYSGELRYTYKFSDLKIDGLGQSASMTGEAHSIHYDFLLHPSERVVQPFIVMGAGIRYYRGTGPEVAGQPLAGFAFLSHTNQVKPLLTPGVGVKMKFGERFVLRLEARDYVTPFPEQVIVPLGNSSNAGGWLHDFTPMVNVGVAF